MGCRSDRIRSAQRPGKRERARVKRLTKSQVWSHVPGVGTVHVKYGRKKARRVHAWLAQHWMAGPSTGEPVKAESGP